MKKKLIISVSVILAIAIIIGGFAVRFFLIGDVIRPGAIGFISINVSNTQVQFSGDFVLESAKAYKSYSYHINGDSMYIKIYGTYVSPFHRYGQFNIKINGDFTSINSIYLEDDKEKNLIWSK